MIFDRDVDASLGKTNRHAYKYIFISIILFCIGFYPLILVELRYHHTNCHREDSDHVLVHIDHSNYTCNTNRNVTETIECWVDLDDEKCMLVEYNNPYTHTFLSSIIMGAIIGIVVLMVAILAIREILKNNSIMNTGIDYENV